MSNVACIEPSGMPMCFYVQFFQQNMDRLLRLGGGMSGLGQVRDHYCYSVVSIIGETSHIIVEYLCTFLPMKRFFAPYVFKIVLEIVASGQTHGLIRHCS